MFSPPQRDFSARSLVEIFQIEAAAGGGLAGENLPVLHRSNSGGEGRRRQNSLRKYAASLGFELVPIPESCPFSFLEEEFDSVHQRLGNRLQSVPFKAIVDEDERGTFR